MMKPKRVGHLSRLKLFNVAAYNRFVEILIEDCQAEFNIDKDGTLWCTDKSVPNVTAKLRWDPEDTSSDEGWCYSSVEKTDD